MIKIKLNEAVKGKYPSLGNSLILRLLPDFRNVVEAMTEIGFIFRGAGDNKDWSRTPDTGRQPELAIQKTTLYFDHPIINEIYSAMANDTGQSEESNREHILNQIEMLKENIQTKFLDLGITLTTETAGEEAIKKHSRFAFILSGRLNEGPLIVIYNSGISLSTMIVDFES